MALLSKEMQGAIERTGLTDLPYPVLLKKVCQFECSHGSHHHILVGTITAIELSDEGGLQLFVSNAKMWGKKLTSIIYSNGIWLAYFAEENNPADTYMEGEFKLV